jgi:hypothetical protein
MDNIALARRPIDTDDWQPRLDHLAEDVVFKVTVPTGTPISGELHGKQAIVDAGRLLQPWTAIELVVAPAAGTLSDRSGGRP